ncbi:MAG: twin-arginine translocase subunit TatB [Nitrospirae bacterium]|nr:twin-arginine translocase subunit TatB [Magnetococcales bacterium]HAT50282.1 twin-arginine translocase subunit TatB [Alphaproteobacteria bacterium]
MLGLGWIEIFVIIIVALLVIGPENLPEVARTLAKTLRQVRRIVADVRNSINLEEFEQRHSSKPPSHSDSPVSPRTEGTVGDDVAHQPQSSPQSHDNKPGSSPLP